MKIARTYSRHLFFTLSLVLAAIIAITQINKKGEADTPEITVNEDPWKEIEALVQAYDKEKDITYTGTIKLIDDNGEKEKILEETPFEYTLHGNDFYYKLSNVEVVNKKDFVLLVEHTTKTVSLNPKIDTKEQVAPFAIDAFKKLIAERKAQVKLTATAQERIITIDGIEDPAIQGYRIYYSPTTYRINKIEIGMMRFSPLENETEATQETTAKEAQQEERSAPESPEEEEIETFTYYLEISYKEARPLETGKEGFVPEEKIITTNHTTIQLTPAYKDYTLLEAAE